MTLKRVSVCAVMLLLWSVGMVGVAGAFEGSPLAISKFSMQLTERTEEILLAESSGNQDYEFVNVPYRVPFSQAGGHPWGLTTSGEFAMEVESRGHPVPSRDVKDIVVDLPAGLLGDPEAVPKCSLTQVTSINSEHQCPADTQVGFYRLHDLGETKEYLAPIVNVAPEPGQSAEFALENTTKILTPLLTAHLVRTGEGYGFTVVSKEIPVVSLRQFEVTFWGVPADPSHDAMRGRICRKAEAEPLKCEGGGESANLPPVPFLSLPTGCSSGAEQATIRADSWQEPGSIGVNGQYSGYVEASAPFAGMTGCNLLRFDPSIEVQPDSLLADVPTGLGVNIQVPQPEEPNINATPHLRDAVVTLPEGMSISPGSVEGIRACEEKGPEGINITGPESEEVGIDGELQLAPGHCPKASVVGTAEAMTPLLAAPVKGHVYLAKPKCGGAGEAACTEQDALDGNLYQLYLELGGTGEFADAGVQIKVPGFVEANPATGQLTTKFLNNPQAPFSELRVKLNPGPRAPVANPTVCGPAVTTARFTPWSAPGTTPEGLLMPGTPDATPSSSFLVSGCGSPPGFSPGFVAGTVSPQAGQFSDFTLELTRQDREQFVKGIQVHTPPGLLGMLSSVTLCQEPQAQAGTCSEASKIGTTRVASGAGEDPFEIEGNVYLTGPYDGSPFGLSIATKAVAGPFNLGLVVVRAKIDVDPMSAALTVTTNETGPGSIPQILFGVPLRLKRIAVDINRPGFMFNPTSCKELQIFATISGNQNAIANVTSPFAAARCRVLAFRPKFSASTSAHTSRANGASLDVKLSYPSGSMGNDANIARAKVALPKLLPSRLTTLQKACTADTFARNPVECPKASIVGTVRAKTPLLPVGLAGPVYFVSHGGEAFPSLIIVLQGDGVRVDLAGATFISKAGITSTTFKTVPDVPVSTFELFLPQGRFSALAASGNLCRSTKKLKMPTEFVAQNGMIFKQATKIKVIGCKKSGARKKGGKHR